MYTLHIYIHACVYYIEVLLLCSWPGLLRACCSCLPGRLLQRTKIRCDAATPKRY